MGIKERVRYFESISLKKQEDEPAVKALKPVSSRKGNSMTMMEFCSAGLDGVIEGAEGSEPSESVGGTEDSEAEASGGEEAPQEEGSLEGLPSQLVVRQGWMSVDWSSRKSLTAAERRRKTLSGTSIGSQPMSPFMDEVRIQGLEPAKEEEEEEGKDLKGYLDVPDGSWIIEILENLKQCECSEWLDEVILALWEDLAVYTELRRIDRRLRARTGRTQAETIMGTDEENYSLGSGDEGVDDGWSSGLGSALPKSTSGDWMRRGMLCERLERIPEAEQAYRVCLYKSFNLTALLALSRIYSCWGWCREAMQVLNRLAEYHDRVYDFARDPYIPQSMMRAISQLVTSVGNMDVRSTSARCHPMVKYTVDNVLKWQMRSGNEQRGS